MSRKILVALAAVAVISSSALVSTSASAAPQGVELNNQFANKKPGKIVHPNFPKAPMPKPQWKKPPVIVHKPIIVHKPVIVRYPVIRTVPVAYAVSRPVRAVAGPCTCLTKQYTPEGAVVFKDICTNEAAINPPPQAPQQTGLLEVQPETQAQPQTQQQ